MNKKNFSKIIIWFLIGILIGILISHLTPLRDLSLEDFIVSKPTPAPSPTPSVEKETEILCQTKTQGKTIEVSLFNQKLRMCENGKAIKEIPISSGKPESPTPTGNFRIINKSLMVYSKATNCWLPFWLGFSQDGQYGFHEVPICEENGGRTGLEEMGQPISLGCVRLDIGNAETLYKWAEIETKVVVY
jgi:lipoprotein-anchoring transpeptidase ErfK/SrfK